MVGADREPVLCERMLVGMCGSVGMYDFLHYVAALRGSVAREVRIVQTPASARMVAPAMVSKLTGCEVWTDAWEERGGVRMPHVELPAAAEAFLVMPATADTLAAVAHGAASTLLQLAALSYRRPIGFVPNMNDAMWNAPSTQRNVARLREDGHLVLAQGAGSVPGYAVGEQAEAGEPAPDPVTVKQFVIDLVRASGRDAPERATVRVPAE